MPDNKSIHFSRATLAACARCRKYNEIQLVILFHRLEWGPLDRHRGLEPWFAQWTASMLDLRATSTLKKLVINSAYALFCEFWHDDGLFRASNDLLVLDSMYDHAFDELRKSLDKYVGKLIEDMLKIVIPTFDHKGLGFPS
ncbi:hypothetical protein PIB30_073070 [Stylosanthes scabra]|uniref:Uncharacterized protein n=1 Tax=Stylosanthes scabra TaxID=79078 RepID=A0ABU6RPN1_9FABA|nr:hypothetical protein [Stylosanthes scabra]